MLKRHTGNDRQSQQIYFIQGGRFLFAVGQAKGIMRREQWGH
jgi:hypothetical protein